MYKMSVGSLMVRSVSVLRREGVSGFLDKASRWVVKRLDKKQFEKGMKDILFVNGCPLSHPERYRVDHQMEQLESNGLTTGKVFYEDLDPEIIKYYRGVVIFRCPITDKVEELIEKAHYFNKRVFFDVDDLVIDKKYTDKNSYVKQMGGADKEFYDDGVVRMGETMRKCDYLITSTNALGRELAKYGKDVFVNRNVASEEMAKMSLDASREAKKKNDKIVMGYLSGSITHNPDLELIEKPLMRIMDEFESVELLIVGYVDLPKGLEKYKHRITTKPFGDWKKLPAIIAGLDINLAPLEKNIFNEAKSENKWMEAALCGVVTVASDFGAFKDVIKDGKNGFLCDSDKEWYEKLKFLIENRDTREHIGNIAQRQVVKEYVTTYTGMKLAQYIESKLAKNIAFALPSTNISGGVNVVLKHCEILRKNGWDAMVINMDRDNTNLQNGDERINVVSIADNCVIARYDRMVATLFTTLDYVRTYANVEKRMYLVQGFETDFGDYGSPIKREANLTYNVKSGLRYVTISRWCQKWLKDKYGQEAKYAPNGINFEMFTHKERKIGDKVTILVEGSSDDFYKNVDESFRITNKLDANKYRILYMSYRNKKKSWYRVDKEYYGVSANEVNKVYEEADILLKSSLLESFSYPPLEMMATGGLVVARPNEGNVEYLKDEENCLLYKTEDEAVENIERLVQDAKLREKLAKNGLETAKARDWKKIEPQILELYK